MQGDPNPPPLVSWKPQSDVKAQPTQPEIAVARSLVKREEPLLIFGPHRPRMHLETHIVACYAADATPSYTIAFGGMFGRQGGPWIGDRLPAENQCLLIRLALFGSGGLARDFVRKT